MSNEEIVALKKEKGKLPELVACLKGKEALKGKEKIKPGTKIVKDKETLKIFEGLDKYKDVPEEAYKLISDILVYIYTLEKDENIE